MAEQLVVTSPFGDYVVGQAVPAAEAAAHPDKVVRTVVEDTAEPPVEHGEG